MKQIHSRLGLYILLFGFAVMSANITGFCFKEFRRYSRSDLIEQFVSLEIAAHRSAIAETVRTSQDFIATYPGCCEVVAGHQDFNWLMWIFGRGLRDVYLRYPLALNGSIRQYTVVYSVDCCAGVWAKRTDY